MFANEAASADDGLEPAEPALVRTHPGLCQGWGECHRWAPNVYPLDDERYIGVHVMEVPSELADDAWIAAQACPVRAITVIGPTEEYWVDRRRRRSAHGLPAR